MDNLKRWRPRMREWLMIGFLITIMLLVRRATAAPAAGLGNREIVSLGTNNTLADGSSFHVYTSANGNIVAFQSWASNWAPDQRPGENWLDVFVRNRQADVTTKITYAHGGGMTDDDSFDPVVTADGRYVAYTSYATNLVPNDTNRHEWFRDGLDVFVYDTVTANTQRVSLTENGGQISGNSVGFITADSQYIIFISDGIKVLNNESNGQRRSILYLRNWRTGEMSRISVAVDGGYPDAGPGYVTSNADGSLIVYASSATNLVYDDFNGEKDIFVYEKATGITSRITRAYDGSETNGESGHPIISQDGKYVVFLSHADNLVPDDNNGLVDIFLYSFEADTIQRVSVSESGSELNDWSRDPSVCADGRYVSFTTGADNVVAGDNNQERDVFLYDVMHGTVEAVTRTESGEWGNARAHRSFLVPDCSGITFATDATNLIPYDTNGVRDLYLAEIPEPADLTSSSLVAPFHAEAGENINYRFLLRNSGGQATSATLWSPIPGQTVFIDGSATSGAVYDEINNQVVWNGTVAAGTTVEVSYSVTVSAALTEFTRIESQSLLTSTDLNMLLKATCVANGEHHFLPIVQGR